MTDTQNSTRVIHALLGSNAHRAILFVAPNRVVRATRKTYKRGRPPAWPVEIIVTIGRPNYLEREIVKQFKKAKEPFPVKKILLRFTKR